MRDGFVNVLKPPGMTSYDVVSDVRRILGVRKAGHAGTLDPGAAGVLPVAVGRATRLMEYLEAVGKSYRAELRFGTETDSGDDLGAVLQSDDGSMPDDETIARALELLTGTIMQEPPVYSAVKVGGRRACDLVRRGGTVVLPSREVTIYRLDVIERRTEDRSLLLDVDCSKGTYIRSLCRDIGRASGVPATMAFLVRTRVGAFSLDGAHTIEELSALGEAAVEAPEGYLDHLPRYVLHESRVRPFMNGLPTHDESLRGTGGPVAVFGPGGFLGVGRYDEETLSVRPEKVYA